MPEAAEVQVAARQLGHVASGRVLEELTVTHPRTTRAHGRTALEVFVGRAVADIQPHGKWIVVRFDGVDDARLGIHLRMSGQLLAEVPGTPHPDRHVHAVFRFGRRRGMPTVLDDVPAAPFAAPGVDDDPVEVRFRDPRTFGELRVLAGAEVPVAADLRSPAVTAEVAAAAAGGRRVGVKAVLLDQGAICSGIGSYLADETLHRAGISPVRPAGTLAVSAWERILIAARQLVAESAARGGVSLADEGWVDLWGRLGRSAEHLQVHARDACATCGTPTKRAVIAGRSARWCPRCQHPRRIR